ncbi:MAG TPA: diguanylate cyclase [bacterium]|nr:diguanylate cyclase [bacterium]
MGEFEKSTFNILVVDDDENVLQLVKIILADRKYHLVTARDGKEALDKLGTFRPDIIICDILMPNLDGYQFRDAIRDRDEYYLTSFIFMSAKTTTEDRVRGIEHGVDAYITKPFDVVEFRAIVNSMIKKRLQLERLVNHDALTHVYNKRKIIGELERELQRVKRYSNSLSIIIVDIDHFKQVNDTHGHPEGDTVLETIAETARNSLRAIDMIGRIGGEEFLIILPETDLNGALIYADRLRMMVAALVIGPNDIKVTISGGIATAPAHAVDREPLIRKADEALYEAKRAGRDRIACAR